MTSEEFTKGFQHTLKITVAWSDMDALAHVNNAKYFTYFESARVGFLQDYQHLMPMPRVGIGPILAFIDCQFMVPITYPDEVIVGSRIAEVGNTSLKLEQGIYSIKEQALVAKSNSVIVLVNYKSGEKVRVPDEVRNLVDQGNMR